MRPGPPDLDVHTSRFKPLSHVQGPPGRREPSLRLQRRLRQLGRLGSIVTRGRQRNRGFFGGMDRGVSNASEGSKILTFLFRPRLLCSPLLDLRSSWKVHSANYFALRAFSEALHNPGPMRQVSSYCPRLEALRTHILSAKLDPNAHKCCGKPSMCRKRGAQTLHIHRGFILTCCNKGV